MFLSCHHPRGVGPKSCGAGVPRWLVLCRIQRLPQASRPGDAFSFSRQCPGLLQAGSLTPCSEPACHPLCNHLPLKGLWTGPAADSPLCFQSLVKAPSITASWVVSSLPDCFA